MSFLVNPFRYSTGCDPDAVAFLAAAGITDATITSAVCTLVTTMKSDGTWSKMKAIYPMVGGTATTHKFNLKNPADTDAAFRLSFVGGWTHSANGALPNGTNAYANTFYNCSTQSTVSNACFGAYSRTNSITGSQVYGAFTSVNFVRMFNNLSGGNIQIAANPGVIAYTPNVSTGFFFSRRESSILNQSYRNGNSIGTTLISTTNLPGFSFLLGALNNNGPAANFSTHQLAFVVLGGNGTITNTEAAALYTSIQAFQTTLSRQV